ncbi:MAG: hypothetical protein ABGW77_06645 [Campylobacterales bacterium]
MSSWWSERLKKGQKGEGEWGKGGWQKGMEIALLSGGVALIGGFLFLVFRNIFDYLLPSPSDLKFFHKIVTHPQVVIFGSLVLIALLFDYLQMRFPEARRWRPIIFGGILFTLIYLTFSSILDLLSRAQDARLQIVLFSTSNSQILEKLKEIGSTKYDFFIGAIVILGLNSRLLFQYGLAISRGVAPLQIEDEKDMIFLTPFTVIGLLIFIIANLLIFSFFNNTFTLYSLISQYTAIKENMELPSMSPLTFTMDTYPIKILTTIYLIGLIGIVFFVKLTRTFSRLVEIFQQLKG